LTDELTISQQKHIARLSPNQSRLDHLQTWVYKDEYGRERNIIIDDQINNKTKIIYHHLKEEKIKIKTYKTNP